MIQIQQLDKVFQWDGEQIAIFSWLNFSLEKGDFISIVGPSGSGKSTFLNLISWIDRDYTWSISLDCEKLEGLSDTAMTEFRWKNISYIFQNFKLIENLTVRENIDLIVELNHLERNFSTPEILDIVWLSSKIDTYVYHLSGWESQRVAIARAFVGKTKILLADEPTGALDNKNKIIIMDLILTLHAKIQNTIILITHDNEVAALSNKVYKVEDASLIPFTEK